MWFIFWDLLWFLCYVSSRLLLRHCPSALSDSEGPYFLLHISCDGPVITSISFHATTFSPDWSMYEWGQISNFDVYYGTSLSEEEYDGIRIYAACRGCSWFLKTCRCLVLGEWLWFGKNKMFPLNNGELCLTSVLQDLSRSLRIIPALVTPSDMFLFSPL